MVKIFQYYVLVTSEFKNKSIKKLHEKHFMVNFMIRTINIKTVSLISFFLLAFVGYNLFNPSKKNSQLIIINVLDKKEFNDCHIVGSVNIPFAEFENKVASFNKNNHYILYCADYSCMSSAYCANILRDAKFQHVWEYAGGIVEWFQNGYPVEGPGQEEYLQSENFNYNDEQDQSKIITAQELLIKIEQFPLNS